MTNKEWLLSLNKQQRRRRRKTGAIPEFAIYRVYNHDSREWQFPDIISSDRSKVRAEFMRRLGSDSHRWRFEIQPWIMYNPVSLAWEEVSRGFERSGKEPLEDTVFSHKRVVEVLADRWLRAEHEKE